MINLKKIEENIDKALAQETTESLTKWLLEHRQSQAKIIDDQADVIKSVCRCFEPVKKIDAEGNLRCGWCYGKME